MKERNFYRTTFFLFDQIGGFSRHIHSSSRGIRIRGPKYSNPTGKPQTNDFKLLFNSLIRSGGYSPPRARIWMKLGRNSFYKSPGASYTAQGPEKQPEILKNLVLFYGKI